MKNSIKTIKDLGQLYFSGKKLSRREFLRKWNDLNRVDNRVKGKCFYCGCTMLKDFIENSTPFGVSQEHIFPQSEYPGFQNNIVKTCLGCNNAKNGGSIGEFRRWMGVKMLYCEQILGVYFPSEDLSREGDGRACKHYLLDMVDRFYSKSRDIYNQRLNNNPRLNNKLTRIIQELSSRITGPGTCVG